MRFWALNRLVVLWGVECKVWSLVFCGVRCGVWWLEYEMSFCLVWCGFLGCYFFIGRFGAGLPFFSFECGFSNFDFIFVG